MFCDFRGKSRFGFAIGFAIGFALQNEMCRLGLHLGLHFLYGFGYIHPPNKDEKKRIAPDFCRLPPPFIPYCRGYNTIVKNPE